uniref:Uncharacterized protein n=1 Tax=Anguilla anguilla TaxID=7936 RepID=A0A0E9S3I8_ANGAN
MARAKCGGQKILPKIQVPPPSY